MAHITPPNLSLYEAIRQEMGTAFQPVLLTKATLVMLSHTLEDLVLQEKLPALLITGFQESSHWQQETERYRELAGIAQQICIFAGKPLPDDSSARQIAVELAQEDPLRQEWFLAILCHRFAVVLCGQDNLTPTYEDPLREFTTVWSFVPEVVDATLGVVERIVGQYRPDHLEALQAARRTYPHPSLDPALITRLTLNILTYQEQLTRHLREAESRYLRIFENTPDTVSLVDVQPDGRLEQLDLNPAGRRLFFPAAEGGPLVGEAFLREMPFGPEVAQQANEQMMACITRRQPVEYETRVVKDGEAVHLLTVLTPILNTDSEVIQVLSVSRDVTDLKRTEQALVESEARIRDLIDSLDTCVYMGEITHADGIYRYQSQFITPVVERLTGYSAKHFLQEAQFWPTLIHPDDYDVSSFTLKDFVAAGGHNAEYRIRRKDGSLIWVENRRTVRHVPELDRWRVYGVIEDVTDRHEVEKARLESAMLKVALDKERELSDLKTYFMTTVSHEFRTPLATILSASELLDRYYDRMTPESRAQRFQVIRDRVEHLREMLDDLNLVMAGQNGKLRAYFQHVDVRALFAICIRSMHDAYGDDRRVNFTFEGDDTAWVDDKLLRRIISNLLSNAFKYSPAEGEVRCTVRNMAGELTFSIEDNGIGIPPEDRPYLFAPFFRGSNIGAIGGTGLGLRIAADFVALHGGQITYESETGAGSIFRVLVPHRPPYPTDSSS